MVLNEVKSLLTNVASYLITAQVGVLGRFLPDSAAGSKSRRLLSVEQKPSNDPEVIGWHQALELRP